MTAKSKSKQEEALQFLDDLDSLAPPGGLPESTEGSQPPPSGEAEVYAFIDEITQKSSEPPRTTSHTERPLSRAGTPGPTVRKSTERVRVGAATPLLPTPTSSTEASGSRLGTPVSPNNDATSQELPAAAGGGWGWGTVWSSASAAIQQARTVVDEQVKKNDQARKWSEGVLEYARNAQLNKLGDDFKRVGLSTLTDILNVVAPPISEHEVIQVWLSHDMAGYDGVESLVYRALSRILEQVEGGDLVVNRGDESRPKEPTNGKRELNAVEGFEAALKLAQANIDEIIKRNAKPHQTHPSSAQNPTTHSYVHLRIQPYMTTFPLPQPAVNADTTTTASPTEQTSLQFLLYLSDPAHNLNHSTVTQAVPGNWLDFWDEYEWVEDLVVEAIRVGVEVIGQEYIVSRMGWSKLMEKVPHQTEPSAESAAA
ncbi:hypothetical protein DAEQUDRAFT_753566 [Daedalea quercina L-15889]|uniref:Maintenance of telomere capping protein 1 n=1 Tax=Daedalea quercina L-15889 TaxID=1314783 RepID=A0A165UG94_9APHY|nr:hypothetical protein DAEQUDRAFT_753566 [Daedalea quercina L-15889]